MPFIASRIVFELFEFGQDGREPILVCLHGRRAELSGVTVVISAKCQLHVDVRHVRILRRICQNLGHDGLPPVGGMRVGELQREVGNLTEAIASGLLKSSPALAKRLTVTESELSRLQAERDRKLPALGNILPRICERYLEIVEHLEE
jgi:hypothetical protein